jgi:hypothetical protein
MTACRDATRCDPGGHNQPAIRAGAVCSDRRSRNATRHLTPPPGTAGTRVMTCRYRPRPSRSSPADAATIDLQRCPSCVPNPTRDVSHTATSSVTTQPPRDCPVNELASMPVVGTEAAGEFLGVASCVGRGALSFLGEEALRIWSAHGGSGGRSAHRHQRICRERRARAIARARDDTGAGGPAAIDDPRGRATRPREPQ